MLPPDGLDPTVPLPEERRSGARAPVHSDIAPEEAADVRSAANRLARDVRESKVDVLGLTAFLPVPTGIPSVDLFHGAVCRYTHALADARLPSERIIIAVKELTTSALAGLAPARSVDVWVARAVTWCIEEYYRVG
jgi:hypothetical protein